MVRFFNECGYSDKEENNSNDEEATDTSMERLTNVQSLDMMFKLKDYFSGIIDIKNEDMLECLKGLQKCKSVILGNNVFKNQTKISDFSK